MTINLTLPFIKQKIHELQNALFFPISTSVLQMSPCVVHVLAIDDTGCIWFIVPRPPQQIHEFDREFAAKMDFFKKGTAFYLKILGKAFIVTDPEEINSLICINEEIKEKARKNEVVLLKVKVSHADYFESLSPAPQRHSSIFSKLKNIRILFHKWAFHHQVSYQAPEALNI